MHLIRRHLTYANVMVTILAFVVLGGGTALADYVISSNSQIGPGTVSGHKLLPGNHANVIAGSVNGMDVADSSLTGADLADRTVDTCKTPLVARFGPICAGSDGGARTWLGARSYCAGLNLRLPSFSEATALALNYDVPGVSDTDLFWTDSPFAYNNAIRAWSIGEDGQTVFAADWDNPNQTVCVTDPQA
jgi:hypothetical protein